MSIQDLVNRLITQARQATPEELAGLVEWASAAPFAEDLLEVDAPLWGGFWQGDVIAPGYRLPAVELALLRAIRLDGTWPEGTSVAQFLADLHQAVADPQAGIWTLVAAGEPCVVFASVSEQAVKSGGQPMATVVWYCATTERLHAGHHTVPNQLNFADAVAQRNFDFSRTTHFENTAYQNNRLNWLEQGVAEERAKAGSQRSAVSGLTLAVRLDTEILQRRHIR